MTPQPTRPDFYVSASEWDARQRTEAESLDARCYALYEEGGQSAVYAFIRARHPEVKWSRCAPCEDTTPRDPEDNACLVCGTP